MHLRMLLSFAGALLLARTLSGDDAPCICEDFIAFCPRPMELSKTGCRLAKKVAVAARLFVKPATQLSTLVSGNVTATLAASLTPTQGTFSVNGSGVPTVISGSVTLLTSAQVALIVAGSIGGSLLLLTGTCIG